MSVVEFLSQPLWQRLGLTLVHFLWQGLAVAVLVGALVRVFRLKHGNARYGAYLLAFIAMIICPVVTFTAIDIPISPKTELVTGAESAEVVETFSYTALPASDILPEVEISMPSISSPAAMTDSIPLGQRISDWLNVLMPWVLVIWMVGVVVLSVRLLMGFVGVYRWRHHLQPLPERLVQRIASLSEGLRMRGFSRVFISPTVLQAMAVGYLRPMVLLPAAMVTQMQPEMLEAVIAHELAHIRRFDLWINLIQRVTETLLFYHPAVWWLSNCIRRERELCCDELAVKATGRRLTYATTLESVGRAKVMAKQPILAAGLGRDNKPTLGRVRHILGLRPTKRNCPFWLAGVITVLFLAALVIPTTLALTSRTNEQADIEEKKDQKELSEFKTTLPNGVTIELVGICEYPSAGKQWWRPDGTAFTLPAGIKVEDRRISRVGETAYQFLFRYNSQEDLMWNSLDAVCLHFSIEGDSGMNLINFRRLPKDGQDGLIAKVAKFKGPLDSTTIQANLATGNWQTKAVRDISKIDQLNEDLYWFTTRTSSTGKESLKILHRIEGQQIKTIAIDKEGNEYDTGYSLGSFNGWASISQIEGRRYIAGLLKDNRLVKFKLQSRPFWSSVIGNVSLKPKFKTDVQIEVGKAAVQVEIQEEKDQKELSKFKKTLAIGVPVKGVTVELMGICDHPSEGKQWWRPDGSLLKNSPYDDDYGRAFPKDGEKGYKFAVKYSGMAGKDIDTRVIPLNFKTTNGGALFSTSKKNGKENIKYLDGSLDEKIVWLGAAFDEELVNCDIRIGVCLGDWKPNYRYETEQSNDAVEWVTFKNVSLKPNLKPAVPVEGEEDSLIRKQDESSKEFFGITDALAVSDISGHLTIKSIRVAGLDGKKLISNKTLIFVDVVNSSDREVNLGLAYYTDSGTIAWFFSPGSSGWAMALKVRPNWQGQLEFPMKYSRFANGGYVKITLARCSSDHIEGVLLPQGVEVLHEKKYSVISVGQQKQVVRLLDTLRTAKGRQRLRAAEELAKYGRSVVPAITEKLQDDNVWAAHALGLIGPEAEDAVPALIKSLTQGGDGGVRGFSASALRQIGPAAVPAIPALIGALKDKHGNTRMHATEALGFLSTGEKDVIEALTAALQDVDETVRKAADRSLKRIEDTISISTAEGIERAVAVPDDYIATLPNGVTVELVGVCEHPSKGKQWWRPDGSVFTEAPDWTIHERDRTYPDAKEKAYEIIFQADNFDEYDVKFEGVSYALNRPLKTKGGLRNDLRVLYIKFPEKDKQALLRMGLALKSDRNSPGQSEFEYVTFKNVSLRPNSTSLANGVTVEQPATLRVPEDYTLDAAIKAAKDGDKLVIRADQLRDEDILIEPKLEIEVEKTASNNSGGDSKRHQHITFKEGMSIREALRFLGKAFKKNIIPSDKLAGQVPVNELFNVTFEEALQAILGTHKYIIDGDFIRVYTEEEFESIYPEEKSNSQVGIEKSAVPFEGTRITAEKVDEASSESAETPLSDLPQEVRAAVEKLWSTDTGKRSNAVMALRYMGMRGKADAAVPYLIDMLGDDNKYPAVVLIVSSLSSLTHSCSPTYTFGSEAAETIARIGKKSDKLLTLLESEDWNVRADATRAVGGLKDTRAADKLIAFVRDKNEHAYVKGNAALALGLLKDDRAVAPLIGALNDDEAVVRRSAASALGDLGGPQAAEPLMALLADSDAQVRMAAAGALGGVKESDVIPALLEALGDEHRQVREVAAGALSRQPDTRSLEPLIKALGDSYPNTRARAAVALGKLKDARVFEPLIAALKDDNEYVRWHAATALGDLKDSRAVKPLIAVAMNDKHIARIRAIGALGKLGDSRAIDALIDILKDNDTVIRWNARDALIRITQKRYGPEYDVWKSWWDRNKADYVKSEKDNPDAQVEGENPEEATLQQASFGPVVELVVNTEAKDNNQFADLDTGKLYTAPDNIHGHAEMQKWVLDNEIDVFAEPKVLMGFELLIIPRSNKAWEEIPYMLFKDELFKTGHGASVSAMEGHKELPVTYLFKTREGLMGILQITKATTKAIHIRYRKLQKTEQTTAQAEGDKRSPNLKTDFQVEVEKTSQSQFSTTLPNGVTVELIGMCEYPSVDKQWWQPDGSLLVNSPYDESDIDILSFRKPDAIPIEFAFRLSGNLGEPAWEAKVKGDEQAFVWWTGRRSKDGKFLTDIKSIGMFVKSDQRTLDLRLGFSFADRPYDWIEFKNVSLKPKFKTAVQVDGESGWGEAVEGVQVRLRSNRPRWNVDETITWKIDVRNTGKRHWKFSLADEAVKIHIDGRIYDLPSIRSRVRLYDLKPGQEHRNIFFKVSRRLKFKGHPFELQPGKHAVKIALTGRPAQGERGDSFQVTSNPVEIEILPKEKSAEQVDRKKVWGEAVEGLRAAVEFVPEKESYSLGERVGVRFHIQNVSDHNIQIASTGWRQEHRIFVQDDEGKEISVSSGWFTGIAGIVRYILKPRETVGLESSGLGFGDAASKKDINTQPLTSNFIRCGPGRYFVHYELKLPDIVSKDGDGKVIVPQPDDWQGTLDTGKRKLLLTSTVEYDQKPTVQAEGESGWGEAVEGLAVRLRAKGATTAKRVTLLADARNDGPGTYSGTRSTHGCWLEVDGKWYLRVSTRGFVAPMLLKAGDRQLAFTEVRLSSEKSHLWRGGISTNDGLVSPPLTVTVQMHQSDKPLELTPGRHWVRLALPTTKRDGKTYAYSNPVEIEILAENDEKDGATAEGNADLTSVEPAVGAGGAEPDDRTPPVRPVSEAELDGNEILKKLKSSDAVYEAAFTASGIRPVWGRRKWKLTMLDGRIAYEEEVVELAKVDIAKRGRLGRPGETEGKPSLVFRSTFYVGPTAQAKYDWVGRIHRYGPLDPWPENGPGPATAGFLDVVDPHASAYMHDIRRTLWCLGRGYSRHITKIGEVSRQEDGRLKVAADGLDMALRPGAKWELVIDPDAAYMVRSARMVDNRKRSMSISNSGLKWYGSRCVPERGEYKGLNSASFEFQSASFEADTEFLKHAKDTMRPPYLIHTDIKDKRVSPGLYVSYDAGKLSPNGRKPDWDIGLEDPKQPATQWDKAVEGLAVRLRAKGATTAKRVTLLADARNDGPGTYRGTRSTHGCWLEVDGKWYWRVKTRESVAPMLLKAGDRQLAFTRLHLSAEKSPIWRGGISTNDGLVSPPLTVTVQRRRSDKPLELTPGRHTVRLAFPASRKAYAYSNAVEIEILPAVEKSAVQVEAEEIEKKDSLVWGKEVNGLRAAVEFVPEKESYDLEERVGVRFHIQNVSNEDVQFSSLSSRHDWPTVKDSDGKEVKVDRPAEHLGTVATLHHIIKPGQILTLKTSGLSFGDFHDSALLDRPKGRFWGSVVHRGPGQYSIYYKVNRTLETGVRKVTVNERPPVDPRSFELTLDQQSMLQAVQTLRRKYRVRICFEQVGSESGSKQHLLTGTFFAPTIPELLDKLTETGLYKWEKFSRTYTVYPKQNSLLRFSVKTDISDSPFENVAWVILDQDPRGNQIEIEAVYKGRMRTRLWISNASAMYALCGATARASISNSDVVWTLTLNQGVPRLYLHRLSQGPQTNEQIKADMKDQLVWGRAVEGVQMRVRPKRQVWYEGETPKFLVDMRNKGTVEWKLGLTQSNWEVELDGLWHRVGALFTGGFQTLLLGPGQEHKDIEFYPGIWSDWHINGKPLKFTPGLHTVRLSFLPSTMDRANLRRLHVVSNAAVIEVLPAEADKREWGEAVAGLQCGLRADKRLWRADETPKLQAVARNVGERPWPSELLYLKAAGKIWRWKGPASTEPVEFKPGEALDKTTILLSEDWVGAYGSDLRLKLSPGKHTVQLVMFVSETVPPEVGPVVTIPVSKQLHIESNVVEIEILPTDSDVEQKTAVQVEVKRSLDEGPFNWGKIVDGLQVGISLKRKVNYLNVNDPEPVHWQIKNTSQEDKAILWQETDYSPVFFEIGKTDEKKYLTDGRLFNPGYPKQPEIILLRPGEVKKATFDLRFFRLWHGADRPITYIITGLYSPRDRHNLRLWLEDKQQEYKDVVMSRISSGWVQIINVRDVLTKPAGQVDGKVEFEQITRDLTIKGIELQLPRVATLQYWNEVFDLDSEMISHYEPGAWRWPKGADVGFDIDMPQEIRGSVHWGINIGYKRTGHRFLVLDTSSFDQAVWETSTKLDELRNSKSTGFGLSKLTLTKFPKFFAVLTDGYSMKADSTVEHPSPKLAIIEVVEAGDKSAEIKYWLERKTQNKSVVQVEAEGTKTEIQKLVKGFWTAVIAKDWQAVNEYSEMDILKQRAGALEHVLAQVGAERKRALSRGINISRIDEVYVEGKEAIAIGPANKERFQWYYLQKRGDVWVIKLFDDAPPRLSVQDVFLKCRSVDKLVFMGERLSIYAAEHQGKLPENLEALEPYIPDKSLRAWLRKHVEYLGKGKEMEKIPNSIAAYTKTLVSKDENISVLYNDGNVNFILTSQVERAK